MITPARKAALTRALNEMRPGQLQRQIDQLCAELERLALSKQPASIRRVNTDFVKTPRPELLGEATKTASRRS